MSRLLLPFIAFKVIAHEKLTRPAAPVYLAHDEFLAASHAARRYSPLPKLFSLPARARRTSHVDATCQPNNDSVARVDHLITQGYRDGIYRADRGFRISIRNYITSKCATTARASPYICY